MRGVYSRYWRYTGKNSGGRVSEKRTIPIWHGFTKTVLLDRPVRVVGDSRTEMLAFFGRTQFKSKQNSKKQEARWLKKCGFLYFPCYFFVFTVERVVLIGKFMLKAVQSKQFSFTGIRFLKVCWEKKFFFLKKN